MTEAVHRVAGAGNVAALVVLCVLAANGPMTAGSRPSTATASPPVGRAGAGPVVFVVIDGLRVDTAADASVMPFLNGTLRARGASGVARVESLIPSSIAGIVTFTTGTIPPPTALPFDFAAPAARTGGLFEQLAATGRRAFVAGPRVWHDLYGRWIDDGHAPARFLGGDASVLAAAERAAASGRYRLVVAHLCGPDEAAHVHGGRSPQYASAAAAADTSIRSLAAAAGPDATIVVTSDHGVTDAGAHGSPEPDVARTPLVIAGPHVNAGTLDETTQAGVWRLLATLLDLEPRPGSTAAVAPMPVRVAALAVATVIATTALLCFGRHLVAGGRRRLYATTSAAVWIVIGLLLIGWWWAALVASLGVFVAVAIVYRSAGATPWSPLLVAAAAGVLLGSLRLLDGRFEVPFVPWAAAGLGATALVLLTVWSRVTTAGVSAAPRAAIVQGVIAAVATVAIGRAVGQTANLSSVEVAGVFDLATHPLGLLIAVAAVICLQAAPAGLVVIALLVDRRQGVRETPGPFLAGFGVCAAAQALPAGWTILVGDAPAAAIGLGAALRVLAEVTFVSIGLALLASVIAARRSRAAGIPFPGGPGTAASPDDRELGVGEMKGA